MTPEALDALEVIRACVASGRFRLTRHCTRRLDERGVVWGDVLIVLDNPIYVHADGIDDGGRERWIIAGNSGRSERRDHLWH